MLDQLSAKKIAEKMIDELVDLHREVYLNDKKAIAKAKQEILGMYMVGDVTIEELRQEVELAKNLK